MTADHLWLAFPMSLLFALLLVAAFIDPKAH